MGGGGASGEATYGPGPQRPRFDRGLVLQQVRELECLDVVLDALDEVGLAVEQPVLLEEGAHERLRLVTVRWGLGSVVSGQWSGVRVRVRVAVRVAVRVRAGVGVRGQSEGYG